MRRAWWVWAGCAVAVAVAVGGVAAGVLWARGTAQPSACPPTTPGPPASVSADALVLSEQDGRFGSGSTILAHVGQPIVVRLDAAGVGGWTPLRVTGTAVHLVSSTGGYHSRCPATPLTAHLTGRRPGTSMLSSVTDAACFHARPRCAMPVRGWQVTVHVR